jgi:hypothetical protein
MYTTQAHDLQEKIKSNFIRSGYRALALKKEPAKIPEETAFSSTIPVSSSPPLRIDHDEKGH